MPNMAMQQIFRPCTEYLTCVEGENMERGRREEEYALLIYFLIQAKQKSV
jgi:hypothetical protein